jgi:hypothetical protein
MNDCNSLEKKLSSVILILEKIEIRIQDIEKKMKNSNFVSSNLESFKNHQNVQEENTMVSQSFLDSLFNELNEVEREKQLFFAIKNEITQNLPKLTKRNTV